MHIEVLEETNQKSTIICEACASTYERKCVEQIGSVYHIHKLPTPAFSTI